MDGDPNGHPHRNNGTPYEYANRDCYVNCYPYTNFFTNSDPDPKSDPDPYSNSRCY